MKNHPRNRHLKIKIKTLSAEGSYIHAEERKLKARTVYHRKQIKKLGLDLEAARPHRETADRCLDERMDLMGHRKEIVRPVARTNQLAYACLREMPYHRVEQKTSDAPDWDAIEKIVRRFGTPDDLDYFNNEWLPEAQNYIAQQGQRRAA